MALARAVSFICLRHAHWGLPIRWYASAKAPPVSFSLPMSAAPKEAVQMRQKHKLSPYSVFLQVFLNNSKDSKLNHKDKFREAAKMWNAMTPEEKAPYTAMADEQNKSRPMVPVVERRRRKEKDPNPVPRNLSPYALFIKYNMPLTPGANAPERMKLLGAHWKALSDLDKAKYIAMADLENEKRRNEALAKAKKLIKPPPLAALPKSKVRATPPPVYRQQIPTKGRRSQADDYEYEDIDYDEVDYYAPPKPKARAVKKPAK